jgi:hypothetical protein
LSLGFTPPPVTENLQFWAQNIVTYLRRTASRLQFKSATASATDDGVLLWDAAGGYPIVSKGDVWYPLMMSDVTGANASYNVATTVTAAAVNTAYAITLTQLFANGITLTGSPATDITFTQGGLYQLSFSAQISSSNSSVVDFRFWPRINGTNATGSTIVANLKANGDTTVVSRIAMFRVSAGDVMKVMWAVNATHGFLEAHTATAYAPASPSVTLNIVRISL